MSWTDERINQLRNMWEKGLTASQIADELGGVSRNAVIGKAHRQLERRFRQTWALYQQNRDLIAIGAYQRGSDPRLDEAIRLQPLMAHYLPQATDEAGDVTLALAQLDALFPAEPGGAGMATGGGEA